jgi:type IV pilus assembly protein PilA
MNESRRKQQGFTIIELMVVVAIVSILAVIALPVSLDYTIRSKVSEGLAFMSEVKTSVGVKYATENVLPSSNAAAGIMQSSDYDQLEYIQRIAVGSAPRAGTITATFKIPQLGSENQLQLVPTTTPDGRLEWSCRPAPPPTGIANSRIPPACRG